MGAVKATVNPPADQSRRSRPQRHVSTQHCHSNPAPRLLTPLRSLSQLQEHPASSRLIHSPLSVPTSLLTGICRVTGLEDMVGPALNTLLEASTLPGDLPSPQILPNVCSA